MECIEFSLLEQVLLIETNSSWISKNSYCLHHNNGDSNWAVKFHEHFSVRSKLVNCFRRNRLGGTKNVNT